MWRKSTSFLTLCIHRPFTQNESNFIDPCVVRCFSGQVRLPAPATDIFFFFNPERQRVYRWIFSDACWTIRKWLVHNSRNKRRWSPFDNLHNWLSIDSRLPVNRFFFNACVRSFFRLVFFFPFVFCYRHTWSSRQIIRTVHQAFGLWRKFGIRTCTR